MDSTLRPMSTGQVLDRTFHLYRNNFLLFAGIAALPPAVFLLGQAGFFLLALIPAPRVEFLASGIVFGIGVAGLVVVYLLALSFATGATVYAVSRLHLGHPVKISESYKVIRPLLWRITRIWISVAIRFAGAFLLAVAVGIAPFTLMTAFSHYLSPAIPTIVSWVAGVLVIVAFVVCFIWSIRLYCSYQLAVPACVLERLGAAACLKRSRFLSKGKTVQRILLVLFLAAILTYALSLVFSIPLFVAATVAAEKVSILAIPIALWQYVSGFIAGTLGGPIATIALALLYYDERVRKEAFDLQLMMDALGQQQQMRVAAPPTIG
jgi:hypothetical protein